MLWGHKSIGHGLLLTGSVPLQLICEQIIEYCKVLFPQRVHSVSSLHSLRDIQTHSLVTPQMLAYLRQPYT